jgi:hypothetical protein
MGKIELLTNVDIQAAGRVYLPGLLSFLEIAASRGRLHGADTHSPHPARLRWAQHRLSRPRPKGAPRRGRRALTVLCYNQGSGRGGACCGVPVIEGDTPQLQGYRGTGSPDGGPGAAPQGGRLLPIGATFAGLAALRKTACILGNVCYNGKRSCSGGARTPRSAAQVKTPPRRGEYSTTRAR